MERKHLNGTASLEVSTRITINDREVKVFNFHLLYSKLHCKNNSTALSTNTGPICASS